MALTPEQDAAFDRLEGYNGGAYSAASNPLGFARGGNQSPANNFINALRDVAIIGRLVAYLFDPGTIQQVADDAQAASDKATLAGQKAAAAAQSAIDAANSAASVNGPAIAARFDAVEGRATALETIVPSRARLTARTIALTGAR